MENKPDNIMENSTRQYEMDNIRCALIFCVVFAHFLESIGFGVIYRIIYSFHMPAFIFVSGYYAKYNKRKIFTSFICPYMVFQILYVAFCNMMKDERDLQFTTPYWLLWYLLTMVFYHIMIPFLDVGGASGKKYDILLGGIIISLLAGFDNTIGYYLSLSRTLTFFPYFILGYIWKNTHADQITKNKLWINIIIAIGTCFFCCTPVISNNMLYGSYSYRAAEYTVWIRLFLLIVGINWILLFMRTFPKKS